MTDLLSAVLGIAFASGLNAYATVLGLGFLHRYDILQLPSGLDVLATTPVIIAAAALYLIEFVADKIPYFDTMWDAVHTFIRPAAGALLAYGIVQDPQWQVLAALLGGSVAFTSHAAKASTRAAVNASPEPFSNWFLSLAEDAIAFALVWLTASHPVIALSLAVGLLLLAILIVWKLSKFFAAAFRRLRRA